MERAFESPVFRTVLGLWMQTNPTVQERQRCLSCHAPAVTVFPQHVEKIVAQVLSGKPQVEGIGCASCHLINALETTQQPPPTFKLQPGEMLSDLCGRKITLHRPQSSLFRGANFARPVFRQMKESRRGVARKTARYDCRLPYEPLPEVDSNRGAMTRAIAAWFRWSSSAPVKIAIFRHM